MEHPVHYETVSEAIEALRKQGFVTDFNIADNCIVCDDGKFRASDFHIVDVYRYEGDTDPGDEAVVFAIESNTGIRGVLVSGYGPSVDPQTAEILQQLQERASK